MGDACEMLVAAELTLAGVPALRVPDNWPGYDVIAHPPDRMPQRVSVKSRTTGKGHIVAFDPATCDWLAIVLLEGGQRSIFVVPRDVADANAFARSKARKSASRGIALTKFGRKPLSNYENNFKLQL
jgi:hypothetical protein